MGKMWTIIGPDGCETRGSDTEREAWEELALKWNWADATPGFIAQNEARGYRAVRLVDVSELRARVEGLVANPTGETYGQDLVQRHSVLALLDSKRITRHEYILRDLRAKVEELDRYTTSIHTLSGMAPGDAGHWLYRPDVLELLDNNEGET